MQPRPKTDDEDAGLDSLMDTMTNVVGILVLVLVMTQLDVQEAVRRITASSTVTQSDLESVKTRLEDLEQQKQQLAAKVSSFDIAAEQERLKRMQETLAAKKKLLQAEEKMINEHSMAIQKEKEKAAQKEKEIKEAEQKRKDLQAQLTEALKQKADLQAKLDKTPQPKAPPPKIVAIPNPRPAPPGTKRLEFVCANNRLYPINTDQFRKEGELKAKEVVLRHKLLTNPELGINPEKFTEFFEKLNDAGDEFFKPEYYVQSNRYPRIRLLPKERGGFPVEKLMKLRSREQRILSTINPQKFYGYFYVLPDSYDVYVTTRAILMQNGVQAGWEPKPQDWVYTTSVSGGIELGPPRPPAPKPTTPTPPPKPANVID